MSADHFRTHASQQPEPLFRKLLSATETSLERWSFRNVDCVHPPTEEKSHAKEIPDRSRHYTVRFVCVRAVADHEERSRPTDAESAGNRKAVHRSGRFGVYTGPQDAGCQEDRKEIYRTGRLRIRAGPSDNDRLFHDDQEEVSSIFEAKGNGSATAPNHFSAGFYGRIFTRATGTSSSGHPVRMSVSERSANRTGHPSAMKQRCRAGRQSG